MSDLVPDDFLEVTIPPFEELDMLVYGQQGTGKTTFFGENKAAMILATEPGARFQNSRWRSIARWAPDPKKEDLRLDFLRMAQGIKEAAQEGKLKKLGITTIVIDTVDRLWDYACQYVAATDKKGPYEKVGDMPYGSGYTAALDMIQKQVEDLRRYVAIAFTSHSTNAEEELESKTGIKVSVEKTKPSTDKRLLKWLAGDVSLVGYSYKSADGAFLIKFHSDHRLETKDRTKILETFGKPFDNNWALISKLYAERAKEKNIKIKSKWS